jgi:hypothetical protein
MAKVMGRHSWPKSVAGVHIQPVPCRGIPPLLPDLLAGRITNLALTGHRRVKFAVLHNLSSY